MTQAYHFRWKDSDKCFVQTGSVLSCWQIQMSHRVMWINYDVYLFRFEAAKLVMQWLCNHEDQNMQRMAVAIISILAAKVSSCSLWLRTGLTQRVNISWEAPTKDSEHSIAMMQCDRTETGRCLRRSEEFICAAVMGWIIFFYFFY